MQAYLCETCGVQYSPTSAPPERCPICQDERQYVNWRGQAWMTLDDLGKKHKNTIKVAEPGLWEVATEPGFAIGQRALLVQSTKGNLLWDCTCLVNQDMVKTIQEMGGLFALAISHPHFYSSMVEWSHAFGGIPIYLHSADAKWVMRPDPSIKYWSGDTLSLSPGLTLIRVGGHFEGSTTLHWAAGASGQGVLLSGDMPQVVSDRHYVSFMRSYPNLIPLPAGAIHTILDNLHEFNFDRIYGGWSERVVQSDAKEAVIRSAERYLQAIEG
jgi:hypothetical protein